MIGAFFAKVFHIPSSKQGDIVDEIDKYEEAAKILYVMARAGRFDQLPTLRQQLEIAKEQALLAIEQTYDSR